MLGERLGFVNLRVAPCEGEGRGWRKIFEIQGSRSTSLRAGFSTTAAKAPPSVEMTLYLRMG